MKRLVLLLIFVLLIVGIAFGVEPALIALTEWQLKKNLALDSVAIKDCKLKFLNEIRFSGIEIQKNGFFVLKAQETKLEFRLNELFQKKVRSIELDITQLDYRKLRLENIVLKADQNESGNFYIPKIQYDKAAITEVKSKARLNGKNLLLTDLTAVAFNGGIKGNITIKLDTVPKYLANFQFVGLDIERFIHDFELEKKFAMTGKIGGNLILQGQGAKVAVLGGDFMLDSEGGRLIIKDERFLENIAKRSLEDSIVKKLEGSVVESLKDYQYNAGSLKVSLEKDGLRVNINLDGPQGLRNFDIILHN